MSSCAILFARFPEPGKVKTRLLPWLTAEDASRLYTAFVLDSVALLAGSGARRHLLAFAPAERRDDMARLVSDFDVELVAQCDGDLGARMSEALRSAHHAGSERSVVFGSDIPSLPPTALDDALRLLGHNDVVLGPAFDGGYYLVGCRGAPPNVFTDVSWSTERVLEQTLARLRRASLGLLAPWYDVDTPATVRLLATHLEALARAGEPRAPHTRAVLQELLET